MRYIKDMAWTFPTSNFYEPTFLHPTISKPTTMSNFFCFFTQLYDDMTTWIMLNQLRGGQVRSKHAIATSLPSEATVSASFWNVCVSLATWTDCLVGFCFFLSSGVVWVQFVRFGNLPSNGSISDSCKESAAPGTRPGICARSTANV